MQSLLLILSIKLRRIKTFKEIEIRCRFKDSYNMFILDNAYNLFQNNILHIICLTLSKLLQCY